MASGGWDIDACLGRLNNANDLGWRAWECCKKSEYRPGKIHKQRSDSSEILMMSNLLILWKLWATILKLKITPP